MRKRTHEVRDPIHTFVYFDDRERDVINSRPFQRLRHIHQLGMSHFLYPGANHTRFEHSLGVMETATRVFDRITRDDLLTDRLREQIPELADSENRPHWRRTLRMASLCHDLGHLPFSHAAEDELLPPPQEGNPKWDHELLAKEIIRSHEMRAIWESSKPPLDCEDIVKLAVGPGKHPEAPFTIWERILAEIIVGDAFGVDRMDYLLRDSYHAGVPYGRFDQSRLIDTLRILRPEADKVSQGSEEALLGMEEGGLHCAEALLLARYFMYAQVYFHPVRRIYDLHLKEFLKEWLPEGHFPVTYDGHLKWTDNEITIGLRESAASAHDSCHALSRRVMCREHFRRIYQPSPSDKHRAPDAGARVFGALVEHFGGEDFRYDQHDPSGGLPDFPVLERDGRSSSSMALSDVIRRVPKATVDYVFVNPEREEEGKKWWETNLDSILKNAEGS